MKHCLASPVQVVGHSLAFAIALVFSVGPSICYGEGPSAAISVPIHSQGDTEVLQPERSGSSTGSSVTLEGPLNPDKYVCGRGDVFELNFWGPQNFKVHVAVDTEGRAFLPKVGYIDIVGKTLSQARLAIKKAAARYYPGLNFDMSLVQPRTFLVHVVGFVGKPGIYMATPVQRVSTLVDNANMGSRASRRRIEIKHRDGTSSVADLVRYDLTGNVSLNPFLMDGDIVTVSFADVIVQIDGAVKRPGKFELIHTKDLFELLELSGGLRSDATHTLPIRLVRQNQSEHIEEVQLKFASDGKPPNVSLHDGDGLSVPSIADLQRSVLLIGPVPGATAADEVTVTKRLPFVEGQTMRSILEGNGALGASADLNGAYIKRASGEVEHVDLEALIVRRDFSADRPIRLGDTVVIPQRRRGVVVEGAIYKPGIYPYNPNFSAGQYIDVAGGPSRMAQSGSRFRLVSPDGHVRTTKRGGAIEPGDTLVLPERTFSSGEVVSLVMGGVGLLLSGVAVVVLVVR